MNAKEIKILLLKESGQFLYLVYTHHTYMYRYTKCYSCFIFTLIFRLSGKKLEYERSSLTERWEEKTKIWHKCVFFQKS